MRTADAAKGRWQSILTCFGIPEEFLNGRHQPCVLCGGKDRARWDDKDGTGSYFCSQCGSGDGFELLCQFKDWDFKTAAKAVDELINNRDIPAKAAKPKQDPVVRLKKVQAELRSVEQGSPVQKYLDSRGLLASEQIMFHPGLAYFEDGKYVAKFPAMVCKVLDNQGSPITFHVTYLTALGAKANVPSVKKVLPPTRKLDGDAIQLAPAGKVLGVAEGIETALAVMEKYKGPCWALINSGNLEKFMPPEGVERVVIFGDNDTTYAGQKSAYVLANKLAIKGYSVDVRIPQKAGNDFADVLAGELVA